MRSLTFAEWPEYALTFLVPALSEKEILKEYLTPFGIPTDDVKCLPLHFDGKKTSVSTMRQYLIDEVIPELVSTNPKYLIVADAGYYKLLTGQTQADANLGYVRPCVFEGLEWTWQVVYVPNVRAIFYDPEKTRAKISQSMVALLSHIGGSYQDPGTGIVKFEAYPKTVEEISTWLEKLLSMDKPLAVDIEAFSLKHHKAGIGTITFCWSKHEGIAFPVDYQAVEDYENSHGPHFEDQPFPHGREVRNEPVRALLKNFFIRFMKTAIYHNISYDVYNLVFQLFMDDVLDTAGLLTGLEIMLKNWEDTQLITYLATNTCAGNELGLKANSQEFSGNYSVEVEDITTVPLGKLLRYNLIDGLSTWYVYGKNYPQMVQDQQLEIYETLFKPTVWDIIQMQLTGLPLNMARVAEVKKLLEADNKKAIDTILNTKVVQQYTYRMKEQWVLKKNSELKKKRVTLADAAKIEFNPNSGPQLQDLLYNMLGLPVLDRTAKKNPSTTGDTLKKLVNHTDDPDVKTFLMAMQDFADVDGMLTTFIPAFEDAMPGPDGWHYLVGSFRLGGTLSGRLSSRNPNMQNLPANSRYAKLIKSCIQAPPGWLFCGLDFLSLEDRISALTTKDPNKLKVYVGHEVYEVTIDGVTHHIRDDATVVFDGRNMTAQEFYEAHRSV